MIITDGRRDVVDAHVVAQPRRRQAVSNAEWQARNEGKAPLWRRVLRRGRA